MVNFKKEILLDYLNTKHMQMKTKENEYQSDDFNFIYNIWKNEWSLNIVSLKTLQVLS